VASNLLETISLRLCDRACFKMAALLMLAPIQTVQLPNLSKRQKLLIFATKRIPSISSRLPCIRCRMRPRTGSVVAWAGFESFDPARGIASPSPQPHAHHAPVFQSEPASAHALYPGHDNVRKICIILCQAQAGTEPHGTKARSSAGCFPSKIPRLSKAVPLSNPILTVTMLLRFNFTEPR
jgi:hypothetical protein